MNYINNPNDMRCCSFDRGDFIRVEKRTVLVDIMGTKVCELGDITPGHSYDCEVRWALVKSYIVIAYYPTEAAARATYNDLVADLAVKETVVSVREG